MVISYYTQTVIKSDFHCLITVFLFIKNLKMEKIIYDIQVLGGNESLWFIDNIKRLLPYILEKKTNWDDIIWKLEDISIPNAPKKGIKKIWEYINSWEKINFFIPWWFRYYSDNMEIDENSLEYKALLDLKSKLLKLKQLWLKFSINFMSADTYASGINNCNEQNVRDYFSSFMENTQRLFDEFDCEIFNYSEMARWPIYEEFEMDDSQISIQQTTKLVKQSRTLWSDYREYVKNRQFEWMYVSAFLPNSVKISFASQMDDEFDWELSSLYITPKNLQKPWAKIKS